MFVKDYMTRHPIMIEPDKRVTEAQKLMGESNIRHLPVVGDGKRLLGLITREQLQIAPEKLGSLNVWEITRYLADLTVKKVMIKRADLYTISPDATVEDAAALMSQYKIGSLPVVEDEIVVGVITETDLLIELQNLLGANEKGWRVTMRVPDRIGEFSRLSSAINAKGWGIMAMGSVRAPKTPDYWDIIIKVRRCTEEALIKTLEAIEGLQIIDVRETDITTN
ncbi:MAG: CBS domain-containing protein [Anaerolineales bacterium]|nr:CBS domain-containing protein [Anaerolineales bacterium]